MEQKFASAGQDATWIGDLWKFKNATVAQRSVRDIKKVRQAPLCSSASLPILTKWTQNRHAGRHLLSKMIELSAAYRSYDDGRVRYAKCIRHFSIRRPLATLRMPFLDHGTMLKDRGTRRQAYAGEAQTLPPSVISCNKDTLIKTLNFLHMKPNAAPPVAHSERFGDRMVAAIKRPYR